VPTTTSAPNSPGASSLTKLRISAATATLMLCSLAFLMNDFMSVIWPFFPGYCNKAPKYSSDKLNSDSLPITNSMPIGVALVSNKSMVCGNTKSETKNLLIPAFFWARSRTAKSRLIASAAAVLSSNREAFAISIPVKSMTIVWKFSSASRRPWAISAWYGV